MVTVVADFNASVVSGDADLSVIFTDLSTGSPNSWNWNFGDGGTDTTQNPEHVYTVAGTYTVTLFASNGVYSDTKIKTNYISVNVEASFNSDITSGIVPISVNFVDNSKGVPTSWLWDFGDGNTSTLQDPEHIYSIAGVYTVTLTASRSLKSDTEITLNYITAEKGPDIVIVKSESSSLNKYWKFYIDFKGHLVFETESMTYRSRDKIKNLSKWTFIEFNPLTKKMYIGDTSNYRAEVPITISNTVLLDTPSSNRLLVAPNSSITLDELRIFDNAQDLSSYYADTRGRASTLP